MIVTGDTVLANLLRELRNHGQDPEAVAPDFVAPGFNCRMTEPQAALGLAQLARMSKVIEARRQRAAVYDELLDGTSVQPQARPEGSESVYQSYVVLLPVQGAAARDTVIALLGGKEIEATIGTYHIPMTTYYRKQYGFEVGSFPVTDEVFARSLTLPLHHLLTLDEQEKVVSALFQALESL
jgi:perosamine synthetase